MELTNNQKLKGKMLILKSRNNSKVKIGTIILL